ncbi:LysR substrate-binding domain-containing protein [Comamonas composti]|uniref:LysR substrate-binding domain-containing protein n=1 Tax=Comamonas composti TaxID=408558 RepID=UPI001FDEB01B|nr:LysR substrate-binding domain-containing protein [Comamonas composti]
MKALARGQSCRLQTNTLAGQVTAAAAAAGLGLAVLPHFLARPAGLVCVQPLPAAEQPIWLAMHSDLVSSRRVRAVADHLIALFESLKSELAP